eukprot:2821113-Pleurochrysis_carterae.AAC.12
MFYPRDGFMTAAVAMRVSSSLPPAQATVSGTTSSACRSRASSTHGPWCGCTAALPTRSAHKSQTKPRRITVVDACASLKKSSHLEIQRMCKLIQSHITQNDFFMASVI